MEFWSVTKQLTVLWRKHWQQLLPRTMPTSCTFSCSTYISHGGQCFVRSAVEEIEKEQCNMHRRKLTMSLIEGLVALHTFHSLDPASTSVQWIYHAFA